MHQIVFRFEEFEFEDDRSSHKLRLNISQSPNIFSMLLFLSVRLSTHMIGNLKAWTLRKELSVYI